MKVAVVVFPGTNCEMDVAHALGSLGGDTELVWHRESDLTDFDGAVLPGFTAFDAGAIATAGQQLLAHGGRVRVKEAQARGGHGQHLAADAGSLRRIAAQLDPEALHRHGVVIEQHLDEATTCSVGEIRVAGRRLAYLGIQHEVTDRHGRAVYGGSSLRVKTMPRRPRVTARGMATAGTSRRSTRA